MSKYLPLHWDKRQIRSILYRIYINIFGIFLRIPLLPMRYSFRWKCLSIWYKGSEYDMIIKKGKLIYQDIGTGGEFSSLKDIDKFWEEYFDCCAKISEKEDKEYELYKKDYEIFETNNLSNVGDFEK